MTEEEFQEATLLYLVDGDEVLLIRHKRGIGEGNINAPGGKVEEHDDSLRHAAVREFKEEVKIDVKLEDLEKMGVNKFFFGGEKFMRVHVFMAESYSGEAEETAEAVPNWFRIDEIPYDDMWPDDRYWMPEMFDGKKFEGVFYFDEDGDELREQNVEIKES